MQTPLRSTAGPAPGVRPRKRLAVVLGAGGVKCAAALGLLRVLRREGVAVDLYVGCSGGSLYAAAMALGWDVEHLTAMTHRLWTPALTARRNRRALLSIILPRLFKPDTFGLVDDTRINALLAEVFGDFTFEEARTRLVLTATDVWNGEQVALSRGRIADAIRASIAIPYIFRPWTVQGRLLADGYLADPMPVGVAVREAVDIIVTMGFEPTFPDHLSSVRHLTFQMERLTSLNLMRANYAFHNLVHHGEIVPIIPQFKQPISTFDTGKIPYLIEEGERAAEAQLPYLRRILDAPSPRPSTHPDASLSV